MKLPILSLVFLLIIPLAFANMDSSVTNSMDHATPIITSVISTGGNITNNYFSINATYNITNNITTINNFTNNITTINNITNNFTTTYNITNNITNDITNNIVNNITNNITTYQNTTEQDLVAIAAMNANISNWITTYNSTYALYFYGARNETIDTYNLYNLLWSATYNSSYDTTTKEWNGNKSNVYNYSIIDQAWVTGKNYLTAETDSIAIAAMNANISAWTNTFNSTYASYSFGARNETIDTFNLYNAIWVTTFNSTYDVVDKEWDGNKSALIGCVNNATYLSKYNASYVVNIASGVTQLAATAVTKNNCSQPIKTTATGTLNSSVIAWSFNSSSLSTVAQKTAWGSLTLDVFPTDNAVNFMICNPTNVSVTSTLAGTNWRVI